jgi:crotonobetainyl-CoA:carnitine CoA-transferase CaiB-like acyl-CoA transferase
MASSRPVCGGFSTAVFLAGSNRTMTMRLGESYNRDAAKHGRPLEGIRVLALEQMQSMPFATLQLARLGAEVVKIETPGRGDQGRSGRPGITEQGEHVGHAYLRYNLGKKSVAIDVRKPEGRDLILALAPKFDVICENMGPGRMERYGLGYEALAARNPRAIYLSVSGFGQRGDSPYKQWPAFASVVEAMSASYEQVRRPHQPPVICPMGGLGDSAAGLYGVTGVLAALLHRERTGEGQYIDISMLDATIGLSDMPANFWSLGLRKPPEGELKNPVILASFRCADGFVVIQVGREHQFERFAKTVGHPEWVGDPRFATRDGWVEHLEGVIRPAVEAWSRTRAKLEVARVLAEGGIAAGPCNSADDLVADPHVAARRMLVEIPRADGVEQPVLVSGNPLKMSKVVEGAETRFPGLGEHTDGVLGELLGLDSEALRRLRSAGAIGGG